MTARTTRRVLAAGLPLIAALLALAPFLLSNASAQGDDRNAPSPAGDAGEVIAQGVADLPGGDMAWRVVLDTAEPLGEAIPQERALGFVVATDDALLLSSDAGVLTDRLPPGEAAFTFEGQFQQRESLGDGPTAYLRLALVAAADAQDAGGDQLVLGGDAFGAPSGPHDLDLAAYRLGPGATLTLSGAYPALILVESGDLIATSLESGAQEQIAAVGATALGGDFELSAGQAGVRVLVATIGPSLASGATQIVEEEPADTEELAPPGQIVVLTAACPANVTVEVAQDLSRGDPCAGGAAVAGMTITRTDLASGEAVSEAVGDDGQLLFGETPAGTYELFFDAGAGTETVGVCGGQDGSAGLPVIPFAGSVVTLELPAEMEYLCVTRTVGLGG
jgi:hypothetical protein